MSDQENNKEANPENNQPENNPNPEEQPQQENPPQESNENPNPKEEAPQNKENQLKEEAENKEQPEGEQNIENKEENKEENPEENQENKQLEENPEGEQNNQNENQNQENEANQPQKENGQQNVRNASQYQRAREQEFARTNEKFNQHEIEDIQNNIQEMTKKIEHEKINLRITTERLNQKEKQYNELQGKPVVKTKEEKERERKEHKKAVKSHKLSDPIIRKKGKEKEFYDEQIRIQKIYDKNKVDFEKLTCDINELVIGNKNLKQQIIDLRKRKFEAQKQLENIAEENQKKQEELEEILKGNKALKDQIKYKEYKNVVEFGNVQEKNFVAQRDDYEDQYHEIIKNYVKREKETKKENAKKRQMALLGSGSPTHFKGTSDKDIEKQLKILAEEEISDRTPILDLEIEKWTEINKTKKITLQRHYENCIKIEEAFKKLTNFLGLDDFCQLPEVFKKTEQQSSNINFYIEKLDLQLDTLEQEKQSIIEQIELLSGKQTENCNNKSKFKEQKEQSIKVMDNLINNFQADIEHKREVFKRIQPSTDKYLSVLGESYISDFVPNRETVDPETNYNEQTVNKYLANVQDYYKIIQTWDEANRSVKTDENREIDRLRDEMKLKLGGFEKNRIINKKLITSMKNELKSGVNIEDIIKKTSLEIAQQTSNNVNTMGNTAKPGKMEMNNSSSFNNNSQMPTEFMNNNQTGNESMYNQQQSSIIIPNNNSQSYQNNTSSHDMKVNDSTPA
jgi:hypothetical protein